MSDLLIRGVEMPKTCGKCPACQFGKFSTEPHCFITDESIFFDVTKKRAGNCPLVNISPHGRLIDADNLKDNINICFFPVIGDIIDNAPTIIEGEE